LALPSVFASKRRGAEAMVKAILRFFVRFFTAEPVFSPHTRRVV